jgi:SAM-dependent methyltransferase
MNDARAATLAAYQAGAAAYAAGLPEVPDWLTRALEDFAALVGAGARVLEIGSGPGRDARELEARGLVVRRTDITPAFVDLMRADGYDADVLDPLVDDLGGLYDGVWASAVLLHLSREEMGVVLRRLHECTVAGGTLYASLKEGDGEAWSTHGHVTGARLFTYWRADPLREALEAAGWRVRSLRRTQGDRDVWLDVVGERA